MGRAAVCFCTNYIVAVKRLRWRSGSASVFEWGLVIVCTGLWCVWMVWVKSVGERSEWC